MTGLCGCVGTLPGPCPCGAALPTDENREVQPPAELLGDVATAMEDSDHATDLQDVIGALHAGVDALEAQQKTRAVAQELHLILGRLPMDDTTRVRVGQLLDELDPIPF